MRMRTVLSPCRNAAAVDTIEAIKQTILSPSASVLAGLGIDQDAYDVLMPSAVASLTGLHRATQQKPREAFVRDILAELAQRGAVLAFEDNTQASGRYDFSLLTRNRRTVVLDVKGGDGNSITISSRPHHCHEFGVWCHLTGSLTVPPGEQARAIVSRMLKVMLNREEDSKRYDFLIVWDALCGSSARPCPMAGPGVLPCVILFPQVQPTKTSPMPPLHDLATTELPALLFDHLGLDANRRQEHVWQCQVELAQRGLEWQRTVRFIRIKDGSSQMLRPEACNPEDAPKPTP